MANFSINGVGIKNPSSFKIERYNVTNMERLANAEMVGDLIAKKRKFYFTYDAIKAKELNNILDIIWETDEFFLKYAIFSFNKFLENGKQKSAIVYVGSIPSELHSAKSAEWIWKNVTFDLIER